MDNFRGLELYDAQVTIRSKIQDLHMIKDRLEGTQRLSMFRETCFGRWLDVPYHDREPNLVHLMLQTQVPCSPNHDELVDPLIYKVAGERLRFGPREFCLITGLCFGRLDMSRYQSDDIPFRDRVFKHLGRRNVRLLDVEKLLSSSNFDALADGDAIRVCLIWVLEIVFCGRGGDKTVNVENGILQLVEDIEAWNRFPWGSHVWRVTEDALRDVISRNKDEHLKKLNQNPLKMPAYSLTGFVWAFKIWIFETFPICRDWWQRIDGAIPRGIGWNKNRAFSRKHHIYFAKFNKKDMPRPMRPPSVTESREWWWIASSRYFSGEAPDVYSLPIVVRVPPTLKPDMPSAPQMSDHEDMSHPPPPIHTDTSPHKCPPPSVEARLLALEHGYSELRKDMNLLDARVLLLEGFHGVQKSAQGNETNFEFFHEVTRDTVRQMSDRVKLVKEKAGSEGFRSRSDELQKVCDGDTGVSPTEKVGDDTAVGGDTYMTHTNAAQFRNQPFPHYNKLRITGFQVDGLEGEVVIGENQTSSSTKAKNLHVSADVSSSDGARESACGKRKRDEGNGLNEIFVESFEKLKNTFTENLERVVNQGMDAANDTMDKVMIRLKDFRGVTLDERLIAMSVIGKSAALLQMFDQLDGDGKIRMVQMVANGSIK